MSGHRRYAPLLLALLGLALFSVRLAHGQEYKLVYPEWKPALVLKGGDKHFVHSIAYSPNGKLLFAASGQALRAWDLTSGKGLRESIREEGFYGQTASSRDGKWIGCITHWRSGIALLDAATGKELWGYKASPQQGSFVWIAIAPDGSLIATVSINPTAVRVWDGRTGKQVHEFRAQDYITSLAFSPDGRVLATTGHDHTARLWNPHTGKEFLRLDHPDEASHVQHLAFRPDGKLLASTARTKAIYVWDIATGKKIQEIPIKVHGLDKWGDRPRSVSMWSLTFSPDGRSLVATGTEYPEDFARLWEVATGKEVARWRVTALKVAFSPDGKTLATAGKRDCSVEVWDRARVCRGNRDRVARLTKQELDTYWSHLSGEDAEQASGAVWTLAEVPNQFIEATERYLRSLPPAPAAQLQRIVRDLSDRRFPIREKAARELEKAGDRARPALLGVLSGRPDPDLRQRAEALLKQFDAPLHPERLRHARVVELLEHIGGRSACAVLRAIGSGVLGPTAAQDATNALLRLNIPQTGD